MAIRREFFFSGQVQGVGFRQTTARLAESYQVTGYVRNLVDGRVELVLEGPDAEITQLVSEIQAFFGKKIRETKSAEYPATNHFSDFRIER